MNKINTKSKMKLESKNNLGKKNQNKHIYK